MLTYAISNINVAKVTNLDKKPDIKESIGLPVKKHTPNRETLLLRYQDKNLQSSNTVKIKHKSSKHNKKENYSIYLLVKPAYFARKAAILLSINRKNNQEDIIDSTTLKIVYLT